MRTGKTTWTVRDVLSIVGLILFLPTMSSSQAAEWTVYNTANSGLPYNGVTGLAIDAQGTVWVGTGRWLSFAGGGLAKFDGENWTVYNTANSGLPNNDHTGLAVDDQGNIWIGTEGGTLTKFDGQNWTVSGRPTSSGQLASLSFDSQGNLWAGAWNGGLVKFDGVEDWTVYNTGNSGLPNNRPCATVFDGQGNVWIGTYGGGLAKFDGVEDWTVYNTSNSGLPNNNASFISPSLAIDRQGNVWIGTYGGGVAKFDGVDDWTVYNTSNSGLPSNNVIVLAFDGQGNVWIGTWDGGLAKFDGENWTVYNKSNSGLPDNMVYSLAIESEGKVWIGTANGGLAVFRPRPTVDFNGNGVVDINDLVRLIESWGQDDPLCDIGPTAFGDGIVDAVDLEVLMSYWGRELQDSTLTAHWKLDETEGTIASDSADDHDGTVVGTPAWQHAGGVVDGALEFNGMTCVVTDSVLNPLDGPFSVLAWVIGGVPGQVIISQVDGVNWLVIDASEGTLATELAPPPRRPTVPPLVSDFVVTHDIWHRVAFVWDGTNRSLYVDGTLVATDEQDSLEGCRGGLNIGCGTDMP
jgi:sugar lactone lactonase YvrE